MKKRNFFLLAAFAVLIFALSGCSTPKGVVNYNNYTAVVAPGDGVDAADVSTYNDVILLLGAPTDETGYVAGVGTLLWEGEDYTVTITFVMDGSSSVVETKASEGLYQSVYKTPFGVRTGVWEWIVVQLASFTYHASNLFGLLGTSYYYWLGLLIMTLVVRTLGWPVYAKSNDLSLKMGLAQPELDKLKEKYAGRTDQASQQRMQMETMEIYKKYKINVLGCLMPFLQMPIFIAMYQVVQRLPLSGDMFPNLNMAFLWTDLGNTAWGPNIPLAIIVAVTMFLSQWLMQKRQKKNQRSRYQSAQQQKTANQMQIFMYSMVFFMAYIALGNAGIAFYWIIGNSYQLFQSYVSHRQSDSRHERLKKQFN